MKENHFTPPLWTYLASVGFITVGIFMLKVWRKSINLKASQWEKATTEWNYLMVGIAAILGGITFFNNDNTSRFVRSSLNNVTGNCFFYAY